MNWEQSQRVYGPDVAVEQINVADESGVEERSLVERRFPSTDQCAAAGKRNSSNCSRKYWNGRPVSAAMAQPRLSQDIALVEFSNVRLEIFRLSGFCKSRDALNRCALLFCMRSEIGCLMN
jgi:hypothetical protein